MEYGKNCCFEHINGFIFVFNRRLHLILMIGNIEIVGGFRIFDIKGDFCETDKVCKKIMDATQTNLSHP